MNSRDVDAKYMVTAKIEIPTPGYHLRSKSMTNDDPFSPTSLKLSSPHPRADATIPEIDQESPLAPLTTSQNGLDGTIKSKPGRRETTQDRNQRTHDPEQPNPSRLSGSTTSVAAGSAPRKDRVAVGAPVQVDRGEEADAMDESQTYDVERELFGITGTPMMDLSVRPPRRIPPTHRLSSHARHETSSVINSRNLDQEHEQEGDEHKQSPSRHRDREGHLERDAQGDREQRRHLRRTSGVSFGSPVATSSPQNARRTSYNRSYDRTTSDTSFSRTSIGAATSVTSPSMGIMAGPLGLGFAPSEMDAYLGIQVACEKMAKTHGFQSDAVFRVYQEVKDLRKAEEIVIGMKRAAEKDAIERILRAREKDERRMSERLGESPSYWGGGGDHRRTSRHSYDVRDEEEDEDEEMGQIAVDEEEDDDQMRVEHLSHRGTRRSASTSTLRHRGGYDQSRTSTTTTRTRERDRVRSGDGIAEYHPPTPTRANLWERLSKSGKHPETALMGESLRASLSMPRYEAVSR